MSVFSRLDAIFREQLDRDEYWSVFGLEASILLAGDMKESDRLRLRESWSAAPGEWKLRAANFLGYGDAAWAIPPLLVDLLHASKNEVYRRLLESLGEFTAEAVRERPAPSDWERIEKAAARAEGLERRAIHNVSDRLHVRLLEDESAG